MIKPVTARHTMLIKLIKSIIKFSVPRFIKSTKADPQNPAELPYYQKSHFHMTFTADKAKTQKNFILAQLVTNLERG
jgi:hypothetical protein